MAEQNSEAYTEEFPPIVDDGSRHKEGRSRNRNNRRKNNNSLTHDVSTNIKNLENDPPKQKNCEKRRIKFSSNSQLAKELEEGFSFSSYKTMHERRFEVNRHANMRYRDSRPASASSRSREAMPPLCRSESRSGSTTRSVCSPLTIESLIESATSAKTILIPYQQSVSPPPKFSPIREDLIPKICQQIEYYFSEKNLVKDTYLRSKMDAQGYVNLEEIANFPKMAMIQPGMATITEAVYRSTRIQLSFDKQKVRPIVDPYKWPLLQVVTDDDIVPIAANTLRPDAENFVPGQPYCIPQLCEDLAELDVYDNDNVFGESGYVDPLLYSPQASPGYYGVDCYSQIPPSDVSFQAPAMYSASESSPNTVYTPFYAPEDGFVYPGNYPTVTAIPPSSAVASSLALRSLQTAHLDGVDEIKNSVNVGIPVGLSSVTNGVSSSKIPSAELPVSCSTPQESLPLSPNSTSIPLADENSLDSTSISPDEIPVNGCLDDKSLTAKVVYPTLIRQPFFETDEYIDYLHQGGYSTQNWLRYNNMHQCGSYGDRRHMQLVASQKGLVQR